MKTTLSQEMTRGAIHRENEYAWELSAFPEALRHAPSLGLACLGGQFWFLDRGNSVYELFWLEADPSERKANEPWSDYAKRSCEEVFARFDELVKQTDFDEEAKKFESLNFQAQSRSLCLMFNAYFVTEDEFSALRTNN